ncbi:Six-hairpin glycosidase [Penicillium taxi]|uniref:Six-hairpin glycosidase n=1 Tax=Penicillium taxi TaxID=168475 RepID=UPI0025455B14|nr:Six-hairpin glycosidase [Penicillium taxi]KAJ5888192.1 Six-hairpin glycosidase [Penicillium taxi]
MARAPAGLSRVSMCLIFLLSFLFAASALVHPVQKPLKETVAADQSSVNVADEFSSAPDLDDSHAAEPWIWEAPAPAETLENLLNALRVMQDNYFRLWLGTWPTSIDWTAAVLGTHVVATLSSYTSSALDIVDADQLHEPAFVALENTVNEFFSQTMTFYFGENAFSLRNQAYDDMLWVVLDWLENVKFQDLHTDLHYSRSKKSSDKEWYGTQFRHSAAHRSRIFYEIAAAGWDKTLCDGGMIWNPNLIPYKNAITNELYISASIGMYLYFPGDPIDAPFVQQDHDHKDQYPHNPTHLKAAVDAYSWLTKSNMTGIGGLYADGFHISNWSGSSNPGSGRCDVLNKMVYTYNQGVILSGLRGLWLATGSQIYLRDGHELIYKVLRATGWPQISSKKWSGLGRGGVLEEICDSHASCSQNGQTFKGIFFHHLAEFCRPLRPYEERFLAGEKRRPHADDDWSKVYNRHLKRCRAYGLWIEHNARAALMTRDDEGKFGMWWGLPFDDTVSEAIVNSSTLPANALDYRNDVDEINTSDGVPRDFNDRGRGRTVETQSGGVAVLRALFQWQISEIL